MDRAEVRVHAGALEAIRHRLAEREAVEASPHHVGAGDGVSERVAVGERDGLSAPHVQHGRREAEVLDVHPSPVRVRHGQPASTAPARPCRPGKQQAARERRSDDRERTPSDPSSHALPPSRAHAASMP